MKSTSLVLISATQKKKNLKSRNRKNERRRSFTVRRFPRPHQSTDARTVRRRLRRLRWWARSVAGEVGAEQLKRDLGFSTSFSRPFFPLRLFDFRNQWWGFTIMPLVAFSCFFFFEIRFFNKRMLRWNERIMPYSKSEISHLVLRSYLIA